MKKLRERLLGTEKQSRTNRQGAAGKLRADLPAAAGKPGGGLRQWAGKLRLRLGVAARTAWRCCGAHIGTIGYYAAAAALLALLGSASYAYRLAPGEKDTAGDTSQMAAVAVQQPIPAPAPTPEPARWVWPLEGEIIGEYAEREPVWSATLMQWQTHAALDISGSPGQAVVACADGTVSDAWSDRLWGNTVIIEHAEGYRSVYAGLNTLRIVAPGDEVSAGQVISSVGNSSACESEMPWHLHFELTRDGEPVDPRVLLQERDDGGQGEP